MSGRRSVDILRTVGDKDVLHIVGGQESAGLVDGRRGGEGELIDRGIGSTVTLEATGSSFASSIVTVWFAVTAHSPAQVTVAVVPRRVIEVDRAEAAGRPADIPAKLAGRSCCTTK